MFFYDDYDNYYGDVDEKVYEEFEEFHGDILFAEEDHPFDWTPDWEAIEAELKSLAAEEKKRDSLPGPRLHFRGYSIVRSLFHYGRAEFRAGFNRQGGVRFLKRMMHRAERRASKEFLREALLT